MLKMFAYHLYPTRKLAMKTFFHRMKAGEPLAIPAFLQGEESQRTQP